jgi:hypothetical protein
MYKKTYLREGKRNLRDEDLNPVSVDWPNQTDATAAD